MTAATKKSNSALTIAVVLIAAGVMGLFFKKNGDPDKPVRNDTQEQITLEVTFSPDQSVERNGIHVLSKTEGVILFDDYPMVSPWRQSTWIPKGGVVTLDAWQFNKGRIACFIYSNGKVVADDYAENPRGSMMPAKTSCLYVSAQ